MNMLWDSVDKMWAHVNKFWAYVNNLWAHVYKLQAYVITEVNRRVVENTRKWMSSKNVLLSL